MVSKWMPGSLKCHQNGFPNRSQNRPKGCPGALLEASRFRDPQKVSTTGARDTLLGTIWAIWGAILGTAGRQGVPKIKSFGTRMLQNLKTWLNFELKFVRKKWVSECDEHTEMLYIYIYIYKHFCGFRRLWQIQDFHCRRRASPPHPKTFGHFR